MTYEIHRLADTIPAMSESEYQNLLADIKSHGLMDPITLYEGKVLDGRHRLRACKGASIEPRFEEYQGSDPAAFVIAKNIQRRHLTTSQKAMTLLMMHEVVSKLQAEAQERIRKNWKKGSTSRLPSSDGSRDLQRGEGKEGVGIDEPDAELPHGHDKHAHTTLAKLGQPEDVSETTMQRSKFIHDHGTSQDVEEVLSGKKTVSQKEKEIRELQKNNSKPGTSKASRKRKRHRPETEDEMMAREWQTCIQVVKQTLLLDPSTLPPGETRDQIARFLRALESKVISQEAKDEMKAAVEGLMGRCQQVLRQLASKEKKSSAARPRSRTRSKMYEKYSFESFASGR